jgi:protein-S-isoprenylcysteine O-methyltransferase Ste14
MYNFITTPMIMLIVPLLVFYLFVARIDFWEKWFEMKFVKYTSVQMDSDILITIDVPRK